MFISRFVINSGKKMADFCANDLQNRYFLHLFSKKAKKIFDFSDVTRDVEYEQNSIKWWNKVSGIKIDPMWHAFYSDKNGIKDVKYIPENIYYGIIEPYMNKLKYAEYCDDKCYYPEHFPENAVEGGLKRPKLYIRNINGFFFDSNFKMYSKKEAAEIVSRINEGYVIKESITGRGGRGLLFIDKEETKSQSELLRIFSQFNKDFIVEGLIDQCEQLKRINPSSINTLRIYTYLNQSGAHALSACLRIGGENSHTDNFNSGGIAVGIDKQGRLKNVAYDQYYHMYTEHPSGRTFAGSIVPGFDKAIKLVENLHYRFGHYRLISWDIAISPKDEPILIEFNLKLQGIDLLQICNGPVFGEYTEEILSEIFKK
ncbi:MAG: sugar-transfer associated ATP-grasp domain-containing protein [Lachnospiraceae bacterium]|nr:sugar-transfer associated ATP-grasp domain-containing protein [Lachnospiraceae bacterium]